MQHVENLPVKTRSRIIDDKARDPKGKLTRWKTGRRFIHIAVPTSPLQKQVSLGIFRGPVCYREQRQAVSSTCLQAGHDVSKCTSPVKCRQCVNAGHKTGDPICPLTLTLPLPTPFLADLLRTTDFRERFSIAKCFMSVFYSPGYG